MSKIDQYAQERMENEGVEDIYELLDNEPTPTDEELKAEWFQYELARYSDEELEAEMERRIEANSQYTGKLEAVYFPETLAMLDSMTINRSDKSL